MKIILIGHRKNVGKDTAARFLITYLRMSKKGANIQRAGFADRLKEIAYLIYSWAGLKQREFYENNKDYINHKLPLLNKTPRQLWIEIGMKLREIDPGIWREACIRSSNADILIIPDFRFPNEAENLNGEIYKIKVVNQRIPITHDVADDPLENYDKWDKIIENDSDFGDLNVKMIQLAQEFNL